MSSSHSVTQLLEQWNSGDRDALDRLMPLIYENTGRIINPGDFGRITSTSNNPRLIQLALKLSF